MLRACKTKNSSSVCLMDSVIAIKRSYRSVRGCCIIARCGWCCWRRRRRDFHYDFWHFIHGLNGVVELLHGRHSLAAHRHVFAIVVDRQRRVHFLAHRRAVGHHVRHHRAHQVVGRLLQMLLVVQVVGLVDVGQVVAAGCALMQVIVLLIILVLIGTSQLRRRFLIVRRLTSV